MSLGLSYSLKYKSFTAQSVWIVNSLQTFEFCNHVVAWQVTRTLKSQTRLKSFLFSKAAQDHFFLMMTVWRLSESWLITSYWSQAIVTKQVLNYLIRRQTTPTTEAQPKNCNFFFNKKNWHFFFCIVIKKSAGGKPEAL